MQTLELPLNSPFRKYRSESKPRKNRDARMIRYGTLWKQIFDKWEWRNSSTAEKKELRHSIIEDLFGEYIEPQFFSHTAWDIVFDALDDLLENGILIWSKEMAEWAVENGTRRRIIWCIRHAGIDRLACFMHGASDEYINAISQDKFGCNDFEKLSLRQLEQLLFTVKNRVRSANYKGKNLWSKQSDTDDNFPF